jgi:raffinose/stachyose/melibiose transport system substrate-binding protein
MTTIGRPVSRLKRLAGLVATTAILVSACGGSTASPSAAAASAVPSTAASAAASAASAAPTAAATESPSAAPALSGSITVLDKYGDPRYTPYFDGIATAYMAANPGVKVTIDHETDQGVKDKLTAMAASNSLPDIYFSWAGDYTKKFVRAGLALDLTDQITGTWKDSFSPAALTAYTYDSKMYGVPITLDAKYLVYNKKMFTDNGIAVPTTLEELLTACDAFTAKGIKEPIAFGNQFGWPAIHYMTQLNAYDVPAATLAADYNPATGAFTDPGYLKALQDFADINKHCLTKGSNGIAHENAQANFINSKVPMHYIEAVEFSVLTKAGGAPDEIANNWGFMKLPAPASAAGDTGALEGAPDGFLVNAKSPNVAIAVDYLKFMTSLTNGQKMTKDLGWLSPVKGSATADNTFPQNVQVVDDISKASSMAIWLDTVTQSDVAKAYLDGVQGMLDGSKTPADVVKDVQAAAVSAKSQ